MGKKRAQSTHADPEDRQREAEEDELDKEMAALEQIRRERESTQRRGIKRKAEEEADEDDEEDEDDEHSTSQPGYNRDALMRCLTDWETIQLPFLETMKVEDFAVDVQNELDDIEREVVFYNHALRAVQEGQKRLKELGVPTTRPSDYFCEQVKSDAHMARVKDRLLVEQKRMEAFEQRKNREQNRKFNKQLVLKKKKERNDESQEMLDDIEQIKKSSKRGGSSTEDKLERILNRENGEKSKKRVNMDKKYGFGGRDKKRMKQNDNKSLNNFKEFNPRGGKFNRLERKGKKGGAGKNRPGKDARQARRSSRSG
jgi:rRNA-processing protein EBP2